MNFIGLEKEEYEKLQRTLSEIKEELISLKKIKSLEGLYLDIQDVCILLKISKRLLYDWRISGKISYVHLPDSNKIFFRAVDVQAFLESNLKESFRKKSK